MNRIDIITAVAQNLGDMVLDGKPVSLTGSSLKFNELIYSDERVLQGFNAYIYAGAGAGQPRVVGSFVLAAREILFTEVFGSIPSTNSDVLITEKFAKSDYDNALDRFIGKARTKFLEDKTGTLTIVATQYEYAVPSGFEWVNTLRLVPSNNTNYADDDIINRIFELPPRYWRIEMTPNGSYIISFDSRKVNLKNFDDYICNIEGQVKPEISGTDNATVIPELEEYLIWGASMLLASQRIDESQQWKIKYYMFRDNFSPLEDYIFRYGHGRKVKG